MSETKGNEHIRKAPFERPTAADLLASSNRQRVDDEAHLPHVGEPESENAMAGDLDDAEWLNMVLENILKMTDGQEESHQGDDDVNDLLTSSLDDNQNSASIPANPLDLPYSEKNIFQQPMPHDELPDSFKPVIHYELNGTLNNQPEEQPLPDITDDIGEPEEQPLPDMADDFDEPEEQPLPDMTDDFDEPEEEPLPDMTDDFDEPEEEPLPDIADDFDEPEEQPLPDIADDFDEPEEEPLPDMTDDFDEPEEQPLPDMTDDFDEPEEQPLPDVTDFFDEPEEQPLPDVTDFFDEPEEQPLPDIADDFDEPEEQPLQDIADFDETGEQPLPDIADYFDEPEEQPLPDMTDYFDEPEEEPLFDEPEEQPLPDIADDFDEPEEQPLPDNYTSPKDTTDKSVDNTKSNDAKQDISGTFEQSTVSVSDGFSPPSLETSGILDGKSKSNEVSDKMENNSNLSKTSKKSVKTKKTDVSRASQKISKTHADLQNTNSSTIVVNLRDILGYIFKNILIVILTALMCSMIGYIFTQKFVKHKYVSNTKLIIFTAEANNESQPSWDDLQLSFTLLTDCSQIVKSRDVLEDVIQELDLSISYSELLEKIDVSFMSNSRIIEISVTDEDPLQAMIIVKKLREVSMRYITDNLEVSGSKIIQKESIPHNPMPSYTRYYVMFGAIIGILVSSLVLAGIYIFQLENEFLKKQQKANA